MSWSVSAVGRKTAATAAIDKQFANIKCAEPEESIKEQARALVAAALAETDDKFVMKIEASGSASSDPVYEEGSTTKVVAWKQSSQTVRIVIEPVWGFVEDSPAAA